MNLSYQHSLWAAYKLLSSLYRNEESHGLLFILDEMDPFAFTNGTCADPAVWQSWTKCCKDVNDSGFLTSEQIISVLVKFLEVNEEEYSCFAEYGESYTADEVVRGISSYVKNGRWDEILNKVYNFVDDGGT